MRLWTIQPQEIGELLQAGNTFVCDEDKIDLFNVHGFMDDREDG